MNDMQSRQPPPTQAQLDRDSAAALVPIGAPEPRGRRGLLVIREADETDADYQLRWQFIVRLIEQVEKD